MDNLAPIIAIAIITWGIYRLFELYARRNERLKIIEKMENIKSGGEIVNLDIFPKKPKANSFSLTVGLLLAGIGLGILIGYFIFISTIGVLELSNRERDEFHFTVTASCVLLFGGIGLLSAYLIERKQNKKE